MQLAMANATSLHCTNTVVEKRAETIVCIYWRQSVAVVHQSQFIEVLGLQSLTLLFKLLLFIYFSYNGRKDLKSGFFFFLYKIEILL